MFSIRLRCSPYGTLHCIAACEQTEKTGFSAAQPWRLRSSEVYNWPPGEPGEAKVQLTSVLILVHTSTKVGAKTGI